MNKVRPIVQRALTLVCCKFRTNCRRWTIVAGLLAACLVLVGMAYAQSGGGYDLTWSIIGSGGGASTSGGYTLSGTIGQPDAGVLAGGSYTLACGFWGGAAAVAVQYHLYLPLVLKNYGP